MWSATERPSQTCGALPLVAMGDSQSSRGAIWTHGIENFAFDALLGKPCFVLGHHEIFRDGARTLREFLQKLSSLDLELNWTTLENAVSRCYWTQRRDGVNIAKMFAARLSIANPGQTSERFILEKDDPDSCDIEAIKVDGKPWPFTRDGTRVRFTIELAPEASVQIDCAYVQKHYPFAISDSLPYKTRVALRRYLSEFRDKYVSRYTLLNRSASALVRVMKHRAGHAEL
jgi:hypothetical protein